jgi:hypothetical protein
MAAKWKHMSLGSKAGFDKFYIPMPICALWVLAIPTMSMFSMWKFNLPVTLFWIILRIKGITVSRLPAIILKKLFVGKVRYATASWRSGLASMLMVLALGFLNPVPAQAAFQLVDEGNTAIPVTKNTDSLPITAYRVAGYFREAPLVDVMTMITPKTWRVNYKAPELKSLKIDVRLEYRTTLDILKDLTVRYGFSAVYGDTSGVITLDWARNCVPSTDVKTSTHTIC